MAHGQTPPLGGSFPWPFSWVSGNYASASASQLHTIARMLFIPHFKWTNTQPSSWKQVVVSAQRPRWRAGTLPDTVGVCGSLGEASSRKPQPAAHTAWDGKRGDGQIVVFSSFFSQFISVGVCGHFSPNSITVEPSVAQHHTDEGGALCRSTFKNKAEGLRLWNRTSLSSNCTQFW